MLLIRTYEYSGATFSTGTFTTQTLDLAIGVHLVIFQDRHLDLFALVLDFLGGL